MGTHIRTDCTITVLVTAHLDLVLVSCCRSCTYLAHHELESKFLLLLLLLLLVLLLVLHHHHDCFCIIYYY